MKVTLVQQDQLVQEATSEAMSEAPQSEAD